MTDAGAVVAAAVIAGVSGIVGILTGIYVGRKQTIAQSQVEHQQWLRGQRREAYTRFLTSWDTARQDLRGLDAVTVRSPDGSTVLSERVQQGRRSVHEALTALVQIGPDFVAETASTMGFRLLELMALLQELHDAPDSAEVERVRASMESAVRVEQEARNAFLESVRAVVATPPGPGAASVF